MNVYYFRNKNHIRLVEHLGTFRNKYQLVPIYHFRNRYLDGQKIIIKPDGHFMLVGGLEHFLCFHILGISSSQLTFICFRGVGIQYVICGILTFCWVIMFFPHIQMEHGEFGDPRVTMATPMASETSRSVAGFNKWLYVFKERVSQAPSSWLLEHLPMFIGKSGTVNIATFMLVRYVWIPTVCLWILHVCR